MRVLRNLSWTHMLLLLAIATTMSGVLMSPAATAQEEEAVENFPAVLQREITLWSDGTRLSGVLLYPKDREEGEKLPAIVLCNGWGGTKAFLMRSGIAPRFAVAGYVVINYDYRGWGDSDSRLVVRGQMPKPDKDGYVTVKAQAIREVVDPFDQRYPAGLNGVYKQKSDRARGLADPVPQGGGSPGGLRGTPYSERIALFSPGQYADRVRVPTLLIDAEKEHYFKIKENSGRVHEILKKNGVPTEYHVLKGKKHYDVYKGQPLDDVMKLEIAWFDKYLKDDK